MIIHNKYKSDVDSEKDERHNSIQIALKPESTLRDRSTSNCGSPGNDALKIKGQAWIESKELGLDNDREDDIDL